MKKHIVEKKIEKAISDYSMEKYMSDGCIVALSGGSDSSALLYYLSGRNIKITAVHINHMIRGAEADRDEEFCRQLCKRLNIKFVCYRIDIPKIAKALRRGIEDVARDERYKALREELKKERFGCIATAHNADDNSETVLFNLSRGCGLNGLCGISAVNGNILRPLIYCEKEEINDYCKENGIGYVTDSTNYDTDYTRNYIRHEIIPKMKNLNPSFNEAVIKMCKTVKSDDNYLNKEADKIIAENSVDDRANTDMLRSLDRAVLKRVIKKMSKENLSYTSLDSCINIIENGECGQYVNLENGLSFKKEHGYVCFIKTSATNKIKYNIPVGFGVNFIEEISLAISIEGENPQGYFKICELSLDKKFYEKIADKKMYVRSRIDGDTIKQGKMTKRLKTIFCDAHIPSHKRDLYPLICDDEGIVAVPGLVARDGVLCKTDGIKIMILKKDITSEDGKC